MQCVGEVEEETSHFTTGDSGEARHAIPETWEVWQPWKLLEDLVKPVDVALVFSQVLQKSLEEGLDHAQEVLVEDVRGHLQPNVAGG